MPQPPPPPKATLKQHYQFAQWLCQYPALTVRVYMRRDLGYRLVHPVALILTCGLLFVACVIALQDHPEARPLHLLLFAVVAFVLGMYQRIKGWWRMNSNVQWHTYYIGTSPFEFRWLPKFITRNRRIARYVDPLVCMGLGVYLIPRSPALAGWLVFSAFCLRADEDFTFRRHRNRNLDMTDSLVVAENQSQVVEQYEEKTAPQQAGGAVATGLADDIAQSVKRRKRR